MNSLQPVMTLLGQTERERDELAAVNPAQLARVREASGIAPRSLTKLLALFDQAGIHALFQAGR